MGQSLNPFQKQKKAPDVNKEPAAKADTQPKSANSTQDPVQQPEPTRNPPPSKDQQKGWGGTRLLPEDIVVKATTMGSSEPGFDTWKKTRRAWLERRDPKKGKVKWPKVQINAEKKRLGQVSKRIRQGRVFDNA